MRPLYLKNVSTLTLDGNKCTGCGKCANVCPHGVFEIRESKAYIVEKDRCMECGACMKNCAFEAVKVRSGVGCAAALLYGMIKGTEPTCGSSCGCSSSESKSSCC
ncbi:MAG TPA: mercury methylation ferredoxin HgcB [Spirochaetota bacterium]|nr:mercury methylation ferredoxin HgcB [Spirochaetota bacterium]HOR43225.1 mercury methylation ferredoxin HgcB [Spirochaetota bacterium]HPK55548.1 mercury methylation ferredoxin HgcB [Spirochaetota bacterium]